MANQKKMKKGKSQNKSPEAPSSIMEAPFIKFFAASSKAFPKGSISVDDLRRSTVETSWSVNENLNPSSPLPRYPLGGSPEGLVTADPQRRIDWEQIFLIPPKNPYLLRRTVELGLLPYKSLELLPTAPVEEVHLNSDKSAKQVFPDQRQQPEKSKQYPTKKSSKKRKP